MKTEKAKLNKPAKKAPLLFVNGIKNPIVNIPNIGPHVILKNLKKNCLKFKTNRIPE